MSRGENAQLAADMYSQLLAAKNWTAATAWQGIAELLLTCEVQRAGVGWIPFVPKGGTSPLDVVVYRETNDFKVKNGAPNATVLKAQQLSQYLADQLGCSRANLCSTIAKFWRHPQVSQLQMHNLVGNAFRSIIVDALKKFGAPGITYEEEVHHKDAFSGWRFRSRSKLGKIDIFAWKGRQPVAMFSTRWRYRHDRVDFIHEAQAFSAAALEMFSGFPYYAVTGEFNPARLAKVLANVPSPIAAVVHFFPDLITAGLGENGRTAQLKSLDWLIQQSHTW